MKIIISAILIVIIAISSIVIAIKLSKDKDTFQIPLEIEQINITEEINETQEMLNRILEIAFNVSRSHEYKLNYFDCTDYSKELIRRLKGIGINAYCIAGNLKVNPELRYGNGLVPHTWVGAELNNMTIQIEARTGELIEESNYKQFERGKGLCH